MPPQPVRRLRAFAARRPAVADALFVLVLLLVSPPGLVKDPSGRAAFAWTLEFAAYVPLIWRRRAPLTVFAAVAAVAFVQWLVIMRLKGTGDLAVLIALYSVAAHSSPRRLLLAGVVTEVGIALAIDQVMPRTQAGEAFVLLSGMCTAGALLGLNRQTRRAYLASLEDRAARLERERDQQAQIVAGEERARIARDVHDIVTHSLSVMVALTDGVACALPGSPHRAADAAGKASEIGRQAIAEMRRMLKVLRDGEPADGNRQPQPGLSQLDGLFTEVRAAGLPVEFVVTGRPPAMASGAELAIFRIIQEALTNIRKHTAPGTTGRVRMNYTAESVDIEVTDDGRPAGPVAAEHPGHGITGMRERVAVYGGLLHAGPLPGGGWRVHAGFEPAQLERTR